MASFSGDAHQAYNPYPQLRERIMQLDERLGDTNSTDIMIFHTGYPSRKDFLPIIRTTLTDSASTTVPNIFTPRS